MKTALRIISNTKLGRLCIIQTYLAYFRLSMMFCKDIVVVHSIGKVGSSAIAASLKGRGRLVVHTHFFHASNLDFWEEYYRFSRGSVPANIFRSRALAKILETTGKSIKIVVPFREPVSRELSSYFQDHEIFSELLNGTHDEAMSTLRGIGARLADQLPEQRWIELELRRFLGIDATARHFDPSIGHLTFYGSNRAILIFRLEDLSKIYPRVFADFLEFEVKPLRKANIGSEKQYAKQYERYKTTRVLTNEQADSIVAQQFFSWLYADFEENIRLRWVRE